MSNAPASQNDQVLRFLLTGNRLSPIIALKLFGSMRLGARVYELKAQGHDIKSEMFKDPISGKRYSRYWIER